MGRLAGLGVRVKKIVGPVAVQVYAVGLYLDPRGVKAKLASFKGQNKASKELYSSLEKEAFDKLLVLKMVRTVGASKLVDALSEAIKPRLGAGDMAALNKFQDTLLSGLKSGSADKGTQFGFGIRTSTLTVTINGKKAGSAIESLNLNRALLNTFVGEKAVSAGAKASIGEGLLSILAE